jgi:hypothetical protein
VSMWATLGGVVGKVPRPSPAMVVALVALLIACSGAAFAAIPSSSGTITTCYDKGNGTLRVIDAEDGDTCHSTETALSWKDGITGKVADSDKLDGKDSSKFARASLFGSPVDAYNGENPNANCVLGEVRLFAGHVTAGGFKMTRGQVLQIDQHQALYNLIGTAYGGNGETTFALPDLRGAEPNGAGTTAPNYAICTQGFSRVKNRTKR